MKKKPPPRYAEVLRQLTHNEVELHFHSDTPLVQNGDLVFIESFGNEVGYKVVSVEKRDGRSVAKLKPVTAKQSSLDSAIDRFISDYVKELGLKTRKRGQ